MGCSGFLADIRQQYIICTCSFVSIFKFKLFPGCHAKFLKSHLVNTAVLVPQKPSQIPPTPIKVYKTLKKNTQGFQTFWGPDSS